MKELDKLLEMGYAVALQPKRLIKGVPTVISSAIGPQGVYEVHHDFGGRCVKQLLREVLRDGDKN